MCFRDHTFYTTYWGLQEFSIFSQHHCKLALPWRKQGNHLVITIYSPQEMGEGGGSVSTTVTEYFRSRGIFIT